MSQDQCPFTGCPLEKTGGCLPEYRAQCEHQAEVILEFHKDRIRQETANNALVVQSQNNDL